METSLIPDLQLIGQLEKEIEREKKLLEEETTQLDDLTKNAARNESLRKGQLKKVLVLFCSSLILVIDAPLVEREYCIKRSVSGDKFDFRTFGAGI